MLVQWWALGRLRRGSAEQSQQQPRVARPGQCGQCGHPRPAAAISLLHPTVLGATPWRTGTTPRYHQQEIPILCRRVGHCHAGIKVTFSFLFQYNIDGSNVNEETVSHLRQRLNVMREICKVTYIISIHQPQPSPYFLYLDIVLCRYLVLYGGVVRRVSSDVCWTMMQQSQYCAVCIDTNIGQMGWLDVAFLSRTWLWLRFI